MTWIFWPRGGTRYIASGILTLGMVSLGMNALAQTPVLTSPTTPPAICSGQMFNYLPTSTNPATGFSWTLVPPAGITVMPDTATSGQGAIGVTLTNTTSSPIPVTFIYTLTASGQTNVQKVTVTVNPLPTPSFTASNLAECLSGNAFNFTNTSSGGGLTYRWNMGDGASAGTTNASHTFTTPGTFQVRLTATNSYGCSASANQNVTLYAQPVSDFSDTLVAPFTTGTFQFTDHSAGGVTSYRWNFGDGGSSTTPSPTHTFTRSSVVTLAVTDAHGCTSSVSYALMEPEQTIGAAAFRVGPTPGASGTGGLCQNSTFYFTDQSIGGGGANNWSWDFGDGSNGTGSQPSHIYSSAGTYYVTETVVFAGGGRQAYVQQLVDVFPAPALVLQPTTLGTVCAGSGVSSVRFLPSNDALTFSWVVSDTAVGRTNGTGTFIPSFVATDTTPSQITANIVVTATSPYGCPIPSQSISVTVNPSPRLTSFLEPFEVCSGTAVTSPGTIPAFTANLAGTTFNWTNSNPVTGLAASGTGNIPNFTATTYAPAPDPSYLTVTPVLNGCNGNYQRVVFTVDPVPALDTPLTGYNQCSGSRFQFTPSSTALNTLYTWSRATQPGISQAAAAGIDSITEVLSSDTTQPVNVSYQYTLRAGVCQQTQNVVVQVNPIPSLLGVLDTSVCSGVPFRYLPGSATPGSSFTWTRATVSGITNAAGSGMDSVHETLNSTGFTAVPANYQYTISANGCSNTQSLAVNVNPIPVVTVPTPAGQTLCPGAPTLPVSFTVSPAGTAYTWTNSNAVIGLNPSGSNTVPSFAASNVTNAPVSASLYAVAQTAAGCSSVSTGPYVFTVNPAPIAGVTAGGGTLWCPGTPLQLIASGGASYQWLLAGRPLAGAVNAALAATDTGFYSAVAINTYGCADTTGIGVTLFPKPQVSFVFATSCLDTPIVFTNTSSEAGNLPVTYNWSDNAGNSSSVQSPSFAYHQSGQYTVNLTVTPQGCASQAAGYAQSLNISRPIPGEHLPDQFVESGQAAPVSGRSFEAAYDWAPATGLSDPASNDPFASLTGQQVYTIAMTFPTGCVTTDTLRVDIIPRNLVYIPNTFTPNGDGHNDLFVIAGLNNYPGSSLAVFDRWGKEVYYASAYQNNWDGGAQPQGVYVYVLELKYEGGGKEYRGTLTMVR